MKSISCETINNLDLKQFTTLKIGGIAKTAYFPTSEEELIYAHKKNKNIQIIGAGSNLLIASSGIDTCLITKNLKDIKKLDTNRIFVHSGVKSSTLSKFAFEHQLTGAEFLIGIPGSIGGAIYMNAGAHGQNIKDIVESVKVLNADTNEILSFSKDDIEFNYRTSTFAQKNYFIISAILNLNNGNILQIKEKMDFHIDYRAKNHPPLSEYSAGSTFRNPPNNYAANLLEKVGAKDYIENNKIKFSKKHANFLYNFNNATSTDAIKLIYKMRELVKKEFNIELHPEIKFIGQKTDEEKNLWQIMTKQ